MRRLLDQNSKPAFARLEQLEAENEELRDQLAFYELTIFGEMLQFPAEWRLTRNEKRLLGVLLSMNIAHTDAIMAAIYRGKLDEPFSKIINVMIFNLRRKLRPFGVEIRTRINLGFYIDELRRRELRATLQAGSTCKASGAPARALNDLWPSSAYAEAATSATTP